MTVDAIEMVGPWTCPCDSAHALYFGALDDAEWTINPSCAFACGRRMYDAIRDGLDATPIFTPSPYRAPSRRYWGRACRRRS